MPSVYVISQCESAHPSCRWWINAFFTGISPFMDPITRDKVGPQHHVWSFGAHLHFVDSIQPQIDRIMS